MTAAFDERSSLDSLMQQAFIRFDCEERTLGRYDIGAAKRDPQRTKKRARVARTIENFRKVMSSENPPQTKQQAVEAVAPLLVLLLSVFFRQLAVEVIEWLWDKMQETKP